MIYRSLGYEYKQDNGDLCCADFSVSVYLHTYLTKRRYLIMHLLDTLFFVEQKRDVKFWVTSAIVSIHYKQWWLFPITMIYALVMLQCNLVCFKTWFRSVEVGLLRDGDISSCIHLKNYIFNGSNCRTLFSFGLLVSAF